DVVEPGELAIGNTPTRTKNGLAVDLVSGAEARRERIRISVSKRAVAASGSLALIENGARQTSRVRVRHGGREHARAAVQFARRWLQVITETVVQRQLASDLPRILRKEAPGGPPVLRGLRIGDTRIV